MAGHGIPLIAGLLVVSLDRICHGASSFQSLYHPSHSKLHAMGQSSKKTMMVCRYPRLVPVAGVQNRGPALHECPDGERLIHMCLAYRIPAVPVLNKIIQKTRPVLLNGQS
jgi:hypothetical protein